MRWHRLLAVVLATTGLLTTCADSDDASPPTSVLPARTVDSGEVEVTITPIRLDDTGATLQIALDTHSVELSLDMASAAALDIDGTAWPVESWTGDGPGGHHREGELRFIAQGPPFGAARLTITGLPEPIEATWNVGEA